MRAFGVLLCTLVLASSCGVAQAEDGPPVEGGWKATTSAGLPIYFGVQNGRVINIRFHFRWGFCGTYGTHDGSADLEVDPSGHWIYEDSRGPLMEGTFVAPDRVEGKVVAPSRELPGCPRTEATFVATPRHAEPSPCAVQASHLPRSLAGAAPPPPRIDRRLVS